MEKEKMLPEVVTLPGMTLVRVSETSWMPYKNGKRFDWTEHFSKEMEAGNIKKY